MRSRALILGFSLVVVLTASLGAQAPPAPTPLPTPAAAAPTPVPSAPKVYRIERAAGSVKVDGVLEEDVWTKAEKWELPYETFPGDNLPARVKTEGQVAYDDERLYVAFHAHDPEPGKIRAHLSDRDKAFSDDFVGIVLDAFNDERRGFEFFVNPLGVQMDLSINDVGGGEDETWDALWNAAGRITPSGYTVEISIPFTSLRFRRASGDQTWGMDLLRVYPRDQRFILRLQRQDRNRNCYLCQGWKLNGLSGIAPVATSSIEPRSRPIAPTAGDFPEWRSIPATSTSSPASGALGRDADLTFNPAVNPDFSQIEADVGSSLNTQFALFFPEKRHYLECATSSDAATRYTRTVRILCGRSS